MNAIRLNSAVCDINLHDCISVDTNPAVAIDAIDFACHARVMHLVYVIERLARLFASCNEYQTVNEWAVNAIGYILGITPHSSLSVPVMPCKKNARLTIIRLMDMTIERNITNDYIGFNDCEIVLHAFTHAVLQVLNATVKAAASIRYEEGGDLYDVDTYVMMQVQTDVMDPNAYIIDTSAYVIEYLYKICTEVVKDLSYEL